MHVWQFTNYSYVQILHREPESDNIKERGNISDTFTIGFKHKSYSYPKLY